jgi:putative DNA primase/helicase
MIERGTAALDTLLQAARQPAPSLPDAPIATATVATFATVGVEMPGTVASVAVAEWPELQHLAGKTEPETYPLDALPPTVCAAVQEVLGFTKAPVPMVASCALSALSLALQAHADVKRAENLTGPTGLFLLTIADSGERKSSCDRYFTNAIRAYQEQQVEAAKPVCQDYRSALSAWDAKRGGIVEAIKTDAKKGNDTAIKEALLRQLDAEQPKAPRVPRLLFADATPEALAWTLAKQWPSGGILSSEAGIVFGAHGMNNESMMRNLALLNVLWDGGVLTVDRRKEDASFTVKGARLTMALQIQEATLRNFIGRSGGLARGTGFFARFLVAWPESTQGQRMFSEPPADWPALKTFDQRMVELLTMPVPIDDNGALNPPMLQFSSDAKAAWIAFHDALEAELRIGGELTDVRDVASKCADNAARLAALFQQVEYGGGEIGMEAFEGASRIVAWHLNEARRFFGELAMPEPLANATRLESWLVDWCRANRAAYVSRRAIQNGGPLELRHGDKLDAALRELTNAGRIRLIKDQRRKGFEARPSLLIKQREGTP